MAITNEHVLNINHRFLKLIINGDKTVEGRLASEKYCSIRPGDEIKFKENNETTVMVVEKTRKYTTFLEMLQAVGFKEIIPDVSNINQALDVYYSFPKYKEQESRYGVLAIWIRKKKP